MKKVASFCLCCIVLALACTEKAPAPAKETTTYKPDNQQLFDEIVKQDSIFFAAYNACDLLKQGSTYSDSIEFFHDQGGFINSKQKILDDTKQFVCGKVTRELTKGSMEVYPIKGYGAVEMGLHQFHNSQDTTAKPHPSKFTILWQRTAAGWKITRVISLH